LSEIWRARLFQLLRQFLSRASALRLGGPRPRRKRPLLHAGAGPRQRRNPGHPCSVTPPPPLRSEGGMRPPRGPFQLPTDSQSLQRLQADTYPYRRLQANPKLTGLTMSEIQFLMIPNAPKPVAPYSHVVEVDRWAFITGQLATDPNDDSLPIPDGIEAQTHKVMDNLARALQGVGLGLDRVVCVRIFLTNFERDYAAMNRIYESYFAKNRLPARTTIGVTALARAGIIEIDMIARRP